MQIVKTNKDPMKDIVVNYKGCGHMEYYGMIHWRDGLQYCRQCIYEIWQKESNYQGWKPDPEKDFVFPLYEDGIDYSKGAEQNDNIENN